MRALLTEEAAPLRRVVYVGRAAPTNITQPDLLADGRILMELHPGVIHSVSDDGAVYVRFVGLEDEPLTDMGWLPDEDGRYPGLVLVDQGEWEAALLSGWWSGSASA